MGPRRAAPPHKVVGLVVLRADLQELGIGHQPREAVCARDAAAANSTKNVEILIRFSAVMTKRFPLLAADHQTTNPIRLPNLPVNG